MPPLKPSMQMTDNTPHLLCWLQKEQEIAAVVKQLYLHMLEEKKQQKEAKLQQREDATAHQQQGMSSQQQPDQYPHGAVGIDEAEQSNIAEAAADGANDPLVVSERVSNPTGPDSTRFQPASAYTDRHLWAQLIERLGTVYSKYL